MRQEICSGSSWRYRSALCALGLAWAASGCNQAADGSSLAGGSSGSSGSGGSGGSTAGAAGNAGQGGSVAQVVDAGADAAKDAASQVDLCEPGSLTAYCAENPCPAFAAAGEALRDSLGLQTPVASIVQRSCTAPDGSARVSVGANYTSWTRTFIYDAGTHQLTGVVLSNDLGIQCDGSDSLSGRHGERAPDCEWKDSVLSGCETRDAGATDAGSTDAGSGDAGPLECVLP